MNFDVTVNGLPWRVAVEPADEPGRFQVSVKGRRRTFDASWIDADTLSLVRVASDGDDQTGSFTFKLK